MVPYGTYWMWTTGTYEVSVTLLLNYQKRYLVTGCFWQDESAPNSRTMGFTDKLNDMGFVGQPVQPRHRQPFITKHLSPVGKHQVGRHNQRHALIERRAELKHQLCARADFLRQYN